MQSPPADEVDHGDSGNSGGSGNLNDPFSSILIIEPFESEIPTLNPETPPRHTDTPIQDISITPSESFDYYPPYQQNQQNFAQFHTSTPSRPEFVNCDGIRHVIDEDINVSAIVDELEEETLDLGDFSSSGHESTYTSQEYASEQETQSNRSQENALEQQTQPTTSRTSSQESQSQQPPDQSSNSSQDTSQDTSHDTSQDISQENIPPSRKRKLLFNASEPCPPKKLSFAEAERKYLAKDVEQEIKLIVENYIDQYKRDKALLHYQRLHLFQALLTYLHGYAEPTLPEKFYLSFSVHEFAQAIVNLENTDRSEKITLRIEPLRGDTRRVVCKVARWIVEGFKVYYLEVREKFMNDEGISTFQRRPMEGEENEVTTEPFFVNSQGSVDFRIKNIADQFTAAIEEERRDPRQTLLKRQVADMMPLVFSTNHTLEKRGREVELLKLRIDGYTSTEISKAVAKRHCQQRYLQVHMRALKFRQQYQKEDLENIMLCYGKNHWRATDVSKVKDEVKRLEKGTRVREKRPLDPLHNSSGIKFKEFESMDEAQQLTLMERCETQKWVGLTDANFGHPFGRGLISLQQFQKDDIIVDYHGAVVRNISADEYVKQAGVLGEYCMEIKQNDRRIIDASSEICEAYDGKHRGIRCLGRLANHGTRKKGKANMAICDILLDKLPGKPRIAALRARCQIEPFEQLRFDYVDGNAREIFNN